MLLRRQPDQDLARARRVVGGLDQGLHAAQEVTEDPGPHQGEEAESRDRTRHDAPTDEGYEDLLPGFPTGLGRAMEGGAQTLNRSGLRENRVPFVSDTLSASEAVEGVLREV